MIMDKRLQVSSDQALTATAVSTDVIDLGHAANVGPGEPLWLVVVAKTGLGGTSPTLAISIETDDNSAFSSAVTLATGPTLAAAAFATGQQIVMPLTLTNERYLRAKYTMGGTSPTATVDAWITNQEPSTWTAFADAL